MCKPKQSEGNERNCTLSFRTTNKIHEFLQNNRNDISITDQINIALTNYITDYCKPSENLKWIKRERKLNELLKIKERLQEINKQVAEIRGAK